jgi:hypothetical protein
MNRNIFTVLVVIALAFLTPACHTGSKKPSNAPKQVLNPQFVGTWKLPSGDTVTISPAADFKFDLMTQNKDGTTQSKGWLLDVDGSQFCAIQVYTPSDDEKKKGGVPLYHFGQIKIEGDTLLHRPLKASWLSKAVSGKSGDQYVTTEKTKAGTGVAFVPDVEHIDVILRQAIRDPGAFDDTERLTRVK